MSARTPLIFLLLILGLTRLYADVLTVTNRLDDVANPPAGSLRRTIADALNGDTINFAPAVTGTITLAGAELVLDKGVSIQGPGAANLSISGDQRSRVFRVSPGVTATISGVTMQDGKAPRGIDAAGGLPATDGGPGGAVYNSGILTLADCVLTKSIAGLGGDLNPGAYYAAGKGGHGGGIANIAGILTMRRCVVFSNKAGAGGQQSAFGGNGGGISSIDGSMFLIECSISGNLAGPGTVGGDGGGIYCSGGTSYLSRCTILQNKPGFGSGYISSQPGPGGVGGGIAIAENTTAEIETCTITTNICGESEIGPWPNSGRTPSRGVGISTKGTVSIIGSTICKNTGITADTPIGLNTIAGGLDVVGGTVLLSNSIIAGNSGYRATKDLCGTVTSAGYNLIGIFDTTYASGITPGLNGDKAGSEFSPLDPRLGPLTTSGTSPAIHSLLANSPAIDAGDDQLTGTDQRGMTRPIGTHVDIGAVEAEALIEFASATTTVNETQGTFTIALVRSVSISGAASVQYSLAGTATEGVDYTITGDASFAPGETQRTLSIALINDLAVELPETIEISLNSPSTGTAVGPRPSHVVQITDNDGTGKIAFAAATSSAVEMSQKAMISVTRTDGSAGQLSVAFNTNAGTAGNTVDFTSVSGTLTFAEGVTEQTIEIPITDNAIIENTEEFTITLSAISGGGSLVEPKVHTVSIQDDDAPAIIQFASSTSTTGESGSAVITVTRGGNTLRQVSAGYQMTDWSATAGNDYTKSFGSVSFPAGVTEQTITVPILEDSILEGDETFEIRLSSLSANAEFGAQTTHTVTILNDDQGRPPEVFSVTNTSDDAQTPNPGSLRQLIADAQFGDTITFGAGVTGEIALGGAQIVIDKKITIVGPGAETLAISGNDVSRIFEVKPSGSLSISQLTLRNGKAKDGLDGLPSVRYAIVGEDGGAILSNGEVSLTDCVIEENTAGDGGNGAGGSGASGGHGGAIASFGTLSLSRCLLAGNRAGNGGYFYSTSVLVGGNGGDGGNGGAIASLAGSVQMVDCSVERNAAGDGGMGNKYAGSQAPKQGRGGSGGGVFAAGTFSIKTSTLAQNRAGLTPVGYMAADNVDKASSGGGIAIPTGATGQLLSSTISGNLAGDIYAPNYSSTTVRGGGGGGIFNGGTLGITSCTVTDNETGAALGIAGGSGPSKFFSGDGGGILSRGVLMLSNSAIALNRVSEKRPPDSFSFPGSGPDVNGAFSDAGHNFIFGDPKLSLLEHYGGLTKTHALLPGSPLLDAGDDTLTGFDQRGYPRLVGARVDIGAVEWEPIAANSVTFSTNAVEVAETAGSITLNVTRSGSTSEALEVGYATVAKTATADSDFIATSGTLHFDAGQTEATFAISILDTPGAESPETFDVLLSTGGVGALVYPRGKETITIFDDDGPGMFVFASAASTVAENAGTVQLSILRKNGAVGTASVSYNAPNLPGGTVTFAPGVTQQTITIPIQDNSTYEGTRSVPISLDFPSFGASLGSPSRHILTITDDDFRAFSFVLAASEVVEGAGFVAITVKCTNAPGPVTVNYSTISGSAQVDADFTAKSGTLQFAAGTSQATLTIPISYDTLVEAPENFTVALSSPSSGMALNNPSTHTVTIIDDVMAVVAFASEAATVSEAAGVAQVMVKRTGNTTISASVHVAVSGGSATAGADFTLASNTITFAPGVTEQPVLINLLDDLIPESSETCVVTLHTVGSESILGLQSEHSLTITDDDAIVVPPKGTFLGTFEGVAQVAVKVTATSRLSGTIRLYDGRMLRFRGSIPSDGLFTQIAHTKDYDPTIKAWLTDGGNGLAVALESSGSLVQGVAKRTKVGTRANPVSEANAYTAIIGGNTPEEPAGYLRFVIQPSGRTTFSGKAAVGIPLNAASHVAVDGAISIYCKDWGAGWLLPNAVDATCYNSDVRSLQWTNGIYPSVAVRGAVYHPPRRARILDDFDATSGAAKIVIARPGESSTETPLTWKEDNSIRATSVSMMRPTVKLQPKTGLFSGTFADETGRTRRFWGACLQMPYADGDLAAGFSIRKQGTVSVPTRVSLLPAD